MTGNRGGDPLLVRINSVLAGIVAGSAVPPDWSEAWSRLGPKSTGEERLAVYRAVRDAGSLPEAAGFYLVSWQIDVLTLDDAAAALRGLEERLESIRREHGRDEGEDWSPGEGPPEYEETLRQIHDAWDAVFAARLEELGEAEMARLFLDDREGYERLREAGRVFFHGPGVDDDEVDSGGWLDCLLDDVAACVEPDSPMGPLGLRYLEEEGFWEVGIYPTPVELVGGAHDGEVVVPCFTLDLEQLRSIFDAVAEFGWNALGLIDPEGPYVFVEGVYRGREIFLRVLAQAPDDEEPGLKLDANRRPREPE